MYRALQKCLGSMLLVLEVLYCTMAEGAADNALAEGLCDSAGRLSARERHEQLMWARYSVE